MSEEDTGKNEVVPETLEQAELLTRLQEMKAKNDKLSLVAKEIEAILVREDLSCADWGQIVEMFSNRITNHIAVIKISKMN